MLSLQRSSIAITANVGGSQEQSEGLLAGVRVDDRVQLSGVFQEAIREGEEDSNAVRAEK